VNVFIRLLLIIIIFSYSLALAIEFKWQGTILHDTTSFTQGLETDGTSVWESSGLYGKSFIRKYDFKTGKLIAQYDLDAKYFAEGLTIYGDRVYLLTWMSGQGFVFEKDKLRLIDKFRYEGQGWGLTNDGAYFFMSDGTSRIRIFDPEGFNQVGSVNVHYKGNPIAKLNELEWINGRIWANVWESDSIAVINPSTGAVESWFDPSQCVSYSKRQYPRGDVLNGIAYIKEAKTLIITGKLWSTMCTYKLH
jgi:glutamine cyclotransferase